MISTSALMMDIAMYSLPWVMKVTPICLTILAEGKINAMS